MPLQNKPCGRCKKPTAHRTLTAQLFGANKKHWWEPMFSVCTECLKHDRYALHHFIEDRFFPEPNAKPSNPLVAIVVSALQLSEGETVKTAADRIRKQGLRLSNKEVKHLLYRLVEKGIVRREVVDQTKIIIERLQHSQKRSPERCPTCGGGRLIPLHAQFRRTESEKQSKLKVGSYCPNCQEYTLDKDRVVRESYDETHQHKGIRPR